MAEKDQFDNEATEIMQSIWGANFGPLDALLVEKFAAWGRELFANGFENGRGAPPVREKALRAALEKIIAHESVMFLEQPPLEVVKVLQDSIKAKKDIAREALEVR